jgi:hypothetical protein
LWSLGGIQVLLGFGVLNKIAPRFAVNTTTRTLDFDD